MEELSLRGQSHGRELSFEGKMGESFLKGWERRGLSLGFYKFEY